MGSSFLDDGELIGGILSPWDSEILFFFLPSLAFRVLVDSGILIGLSGAEH